MIAIIDFGSQYTQLIARRVREAHVFCEVLPYWTTIEELQKYSGIIISGSPKSVKTTDAPKPAEKIFEMGKPVLGLCYGMQLMASMLGGEVEKGKAGEYGRTQTCLDTKNQLFYGLNTESTVWMSHGDHVVKIPGGFEKIASSQTCGIAGIQNTTKNLYGIQFHPEVSHTENGQLIIENFIFKMCKEEPNWKMSAFANDQIEKIKEQVGNDHVIAGVSGGVDSVVTAVLLYKAIGKQLHTFFVDHGLLRQNEREEVESALTNLGLEPMIIDCEESFLSQLEGVTDPEQKRKIIGRLFIEEFENVTKSIPNAKWRIECIFTVFYLIFEELFKFFCRQCLNKWVLRHIGLDDDFAVRYF